MSKLEEMVFLEGGQHLRNKDYITITRYEYKKLKEAYDNKQDFKNLFTKLTEREIALEKKEKDLIKFEKKIRYEVHKKILDLAKGFISY
jgi:DNA mismatch repair ATPase MutS